MQGGAEMVAGDEEILAPLLLGQDMGGAACMNLKLPRKEIRCLRDDIVIPPHAGELTLSFKPRERAVKIGNIMSIKSQCPRDGRSGKRIVLKQSENRLYIVILSATCDRLSASRGGGISRAGRFLSGSGLSFPRARSGGFACRSGLFFHSSSLGSLTSVAVRAMWTSLRGLAAGGLASMFAVIRHG